MGCAGEKQFLTLIFFALDTTIHRLKRRFNDSRSQRNIGKLNDDLQDVTRIMTMNIQDVLGRGEKLESTAAPCSCAFCVTDRDVSEMTEISSQLTSETRKYAKNASDINMQLLYRKYGLPVMVLLIVLVVLYIRFAFF